VTAHTLDARAGGDGPSPEDLAATRQALIELRHARRHNHREAVHWIDALYRVYIAGLVGAVVIIVGAGVFGDTKITAAQADTFAANVTPWLGLLLAVAAGIGLRSGGRGGPLTLEAPTVQHELLAPIDHAWALREPAFKQLRFMAFTGACVGAVIGILGIHQLEVNGAVLIATCAATFSLGTAAALSLAMIVSGHRLGIRVANAIAVVLLAWSAIDIAAKVTTSPFTLLASLAFAAITFKPLCVVGVALALAVIPLALGSLGGTSIDDARRRAGLVSQLRFAVTLQDIRTVVLLRRQLAQETPRARPWIRFGRGGRLPAVWRRDWRSYFRFPLVRILRMLLLGAVAGFALGVAWNGAKAVFLIAALALYLAGYDAVEPLAQEVDHPSRWDDLPVDHGRLLLRHLPAAFVVMVVVCGVAGLTALTMVPAQVVWTELPRLIVPAALAAMTGAALSTVMGAPDMSKMMAGMGADIMGFVMFFRLIFPPALTVAALAPIFSFGVTVDQLDLDRASNLIGYPIILCACCLVYIGYQKVDRI
jgi:hypothetical protein